VLERDPGGRPPAPAPLAAVQALVNTVDLEHGVDALTAPEALEALLRDHGLLRGGAPVGEADLVRGRELREALRALLMARHGFPPQAAERTALERAARDAQLALVADGGGALALAAAREGPAGAFGRLLAAVHAAMLDGSWRRLKACPRDVCRWAFWDASPGVSGVWCSMAVCGNRTKVRRFRGNAEPR
jgi:predicted RNA-binding Zn ribbon-like protein